MADDRQSAEPPTPADRVDTPSGTRTGDLTTPSRPAAPAQPTQATPAPSTSRHDSDSAAAASVARQPSALAKASSAARPVVIAVRIRLAGAVWTVAMLAAFALALGALLVALGANQDNALVSAVLDIDRAIDGPFWKVFDFYKDSESGGQGPPDEVKNHLVNWGLAAAGYLVVGQLLYRVVQPSSR